MLTSLLARFRKDPIQSTILLSVLITHVVFLLVILISPQFAPRKKDHKPLIVKTFIPKAAAKIAAVEKKSPRSIPAPKAATPLPQKPQVKKQELPKTQNKPKLEPKKEATPAPVKKQAAKPAPAVKKEPAIADKTFRKAKQTEPKKTPPPPNRAKISDSLLQELEESIAKIENKSDKTKLSQSTHANKAPLAPIALQIDAMTNDSSEEESDYRSALVNHLHRALSLPDYGEVKIQLSLRQDGTVAKVIVLKAQSEKNRQYLESNLPRLKFPRFDGAYANTNESTFVLTFCNEL